MSDSVAVSDDEIEKHRNARVFCFLNEKEVEGFERAYMIMMQELQKRQTRMYMDEDNILHYNHGATWIRHGHHDDDGPQMHTFSTEWSIPHQSIVHNDLSLIETGLSKAVDSLSAQFAQSIYGIVGTAAEKVGNVVNRQETDSNAQAFIEMLKKIEFGVDREGNVSLPQIHMGPDMADKFIKELQSQPLEFTEEIERVKAERSDLALKKETERKARFKAAR